MKLDTKSYANFVYLQNLAQEISDLPHGLFESFEEIEYLNNEIWLNNVTKSPIERLLFAEILFLTDGYNRVEFLDFPEDKFIGTWVCPQYKVGKYTVDFMFGTNYKNNLSFLAVECDGHDFHEKTKEQAAHDKKRDRFLLNNGIPTLRFSGSEIYNSHRECSEEIGRFLYKSSFRMIEA